MKRIQGMVLVLAVALLAGGWLQGQDKKDDPVKVKGVLPANWAKLGLSDKQKQDVYKVQGDYHDKIAALEKQVKDLKAQEKTEMEKVLTDAQKARLKEIILEKAGLKDDKKPDEKK
jgi:hypothetical protein